MASVNLAKRATEQAYKIGYGQFEVKTAEMARISLARHSCASAIGCGKERMTELSWLTLNQTSRTSGDGCKTDTIVGYEKRIIRHS